MKLVMVTPASKHSAIARSANLIVNQIQQLGHDISIIRSEADNKIDDPAFPFAEQAVKWTKTVSVEKLLAKTKLVIYQVGDNYEYHAGCIHLIEKHPGLVILHDFFLTHLYLERYKNDIAALLNTEIQKWYGIKVANEFLSHHNDISYTAQHAPMIESIANNALGVITHSLGSIERVLKACKGTVACIPLAYDAPFLGLLKKQATVNNRCVLLTFGYLNANKRINSIIKAIGSNTILKEKIIYKLVGAISKKRNQELLQLANRYGVTIELIKHDGDEEFAQEIVNADIVSCLRYPVLEAFSASTIEAMLYGKVIMITDADYYQDFPDDCMIKISIESEINSIQSFLINYLNNRKQFEPYGIRAQQWAKQTFDVHAYAQKLIEVANHLLRYRQIEQATLDISKKLVKWHIGKNSPIISTILEPVQAIFTIPIESS